MKLVKLLTKLLIIIITGVAVFSILPSMSKAKCSLFVLGIDEQNNSEYKSISEIILQNRFNKYNKLEEFDSVQLNVLQKYHDREKTVGFYSKEPLTLSEIYAKKGEMIQTDNIIGGIPFQRFVEAYWSKDYFILCTNVGGFGESTLFEFFEFRNNNLYMIENINMLGRSIYDLALHLKFDRTLFSNNKRDSGFEN